MGGETRSCSSLRVSRSLRIHVHQRIVPPPRCLRNALGLSSICMILSKGSPLATPMPTPLGRACPSRWQGQRRARRLEKLPDGNSSRWEEDLGRWDVRWQVLLPMARCQSS